MIPASTRRFLAPIGLSLSLLATAAFGGNFVTFESGQVRPLALSPDGSQLFAVDTPDDRLEIFDVTASGLTHRASVPVGMEPVAVAARSANEVWVVNLLSDSVSIVDVVGRPAARGAHAAGRRRAARHRLRRPRRQPRLHHHGPPRPAADGSRRSRAFRARATRSSPRPASAAPTSGCSTRTRSAPDSAACRSASSRSSATRRAPWP